MWWFLCKKNYNDDMVTYTYGKETRIQSGEIIFDRKNEKFNVVKLADNDTYKGASMLFPHLYRIIYKENCPDERQVAIG